MFSRFNFKGELSQSWGVLNLIPPEGLELKALMLGKATQALSATSRRDPQVRGSIGSAGALKPSSLKLSYNERDVSLSRQINNDHSQSAVGSRPVNRFQGSSKLGSSRVL